MAKGRESRSFTVFSFCVWACVAFIVLTSLAMVVYPGGSRAHHEATRYDFTHNFFSDLGRTQTYNGSANGVSMFLFTTALTLAGLALGSFFVGFARFFRRNPLWGALAAVGTFWGILAGLCFVGVAWAPANVQPLIHVRCVAWAFRSYLLAVAIYSVVIWFDGRYPRRLAWVFVFFAMLLFGYILLLTQGPSTRTATGLFIQVVGQKLIVYASIVCTGAQAAAAHAFARRMALEKLASTPGPIAGVKP